MATQTLLTNAAQVSSVEQFYFSPVAVLPFAPDVPLSSIYCFLSRVDPWEDDANPPVPTQDVASIKQIHKNIFAVKLVQSNEISPVIERIDWTENNVYDFYTDMENMFEVGMDGTLVKKFYVRNKYDQVFKCLWNANGANSTVEPYFEPGTYDTNNIFEGVDGYKWKFMYTIDTGSKVKFMDKSWLPVPVGNNTTNPLISAAGAGSIDVINVTHGGSGYDLANAVISVTVTGDGTGAAGRVTSSDIVDGVIKNVTVTNPGTNYTYANVKINSSLGSGAVVIAPTSPIGGHAFDPISELGCSRVMMSVEFNGSESGLIPTDITYHQLGVVVSPTTHSLNPAPANNTVYSTTTDLIVAPGFGAYTNDEIVWQGNTFETATYIGTVLSFDEASNVVKLINITGNPTLNAPVFGRTSVTTRTLLSVNNPDFVILSGYMAFIENRSAIQRSADGIEQVKIVLGY